MNVVKEYHINFIIYYFLAYTILLKVSKLLVTVTLEEDRPWPCLDPCVAVFPCYLVGKRWVSVLVENYSHFLERTDNPNLLIRTDSRTE